MRIVDHNEVLATVLTLYWLIADPLPHIARPVILVNFFVMVSMEEKSILSVIILGFEATCIANNVGAGDFLMILSTISGSFLFYKLMNSLLF